MSIERVGRNESPIYNEERKEEKAIANWVWWAIFIIGSVVKGILDVKKGKK